MRQFLANFVGFVAAMALLPVYCKAEDDVLKEKIVRETLSQNEPAVIKVGTIGVTSLEFPYRIEAIDGYGFSATPGTEDAFQISYTKGTNYFSVRALKAGVTGNLTVVLDQKVYSLFFEECANPSFATIFRPGSDRRLTATDLRELIKELGDPKSEVLTFNQPPANYLPTAATIGEVGSESKTHVATGHSTGSGKHAGAKRVAKKTEPSADVTRRVTK